MVDAAEYDVMPHVVTRPVGGLRVGRAWAYGDVFSAGAKTVRVVRVETVCDGKLEEGRGDETMAYSNGALYTLRRFVALGGRTGNVGGMVGGGVIREDSFPHHLFGWGIVIKEGGVPVVRSVGYLQPVIRSIGYLHLSAPEVRLFPKFRPSGRSWPSPLISDKIYRRRIVISKVNSDKLSYIKGHVRIPMGCKREYFVGDGFGSQP